MTGVSVAGIGSVIPAPGDIDRAALVTRVVDAALGDRDRAGIDVLVCGQAALSPAESGGSSFLGMRLGFDRSVVLSNACASGGFAVDLGARLLRADLAERVLVVGVRVPDRREELSLEVVRALSPDAARPFDQARNGMRLGTGAVALLLEKDAGRPLARLAGSSCLLAPGRADTDAAALATVMTAALGELSGVDAVAAHATGTRAGDDAELVALETVGKDRGWTGVPVFSNKGRIGHLLHASALATAVHVIEAMDAGVLPGTDGCADPIPAGAAIEINRADRPARLHRVLINAIGFGGNYATLILERP